MVAAVSSLAQLAMLVRPSSVAYSPRSGCTAQLTTIFPAGPPAPGLPGVQSSGDTGVNTLPWYSELNSDN